MVNFSSECGILNVSCKFGIMGKCLLEELKGELLFFYIVITFYFSEDLAKKAARKMARECQVIMERSGEKIRLHNYRVFNMKVTWKLPFRIDITKVSNNTLFLF